MNKTLIYMMIGATFFGSSHTASTMPTIDKRIESSTKTIENNGSKDMIKEYIVNNTLPINTANNNTKNNYNESIKINYSVTEINTKNISSSQASKTIKKAKPFADIIKKHALNNNVSEELAHAVIKAESSYNKNARGQAGEIGLMQIKLSTARALGYSGSAKGLYEPYTNIKFGMKYLGQANKLGEGDTCTTLLKYNAGHNAKRMNNTSLRYCKKIKSFMAAEKIKSLMAAMD